MGPSNMSFLSFRVIFHFHDCGRKGSPRNSSQKQLPLSKISHLWPRNARRLASSCMTPGTAHVPSRVDVNTHVSPAPTWQRCVHAWGKEENGVENVPAITPDPHPQKRKGCSHSIRNCHVTWQSSKKLRFNHINAGILHRLLSVDRQNTSERTGFATWNSKLAKWSDQPPPTTKQVSWNLGKNQGSLPQTSPPKKTSPHPQNSAAHVDRVGYRGPPNHFPYEGMYDVTLKPVDMCLHSTHQPYIQPHFLRLFLGGQGGKFKDVHHIPIGSMCMASFTYMNGWFLYGFFCREIYHTWILRHFAPFEGVVVFCFPRREGGGMTRSPLCFGGELREKR